MPAFRESFRKPKALRIPETVPEQAPKQGMQKTLWMAPEQEQMQALMKVLWMMLWPGCFRRQNRSVFP